jgi:carbonic anhydrase/acetyltransferase-like protein (isoleucine patch superfamily)
MGYKIWKPSNIWGNNIIGEYTTIGAFCDIGNAVIGKNCKIQCHVSIPPMTIIGDEVFLGPGVRIANDKKMDGNLKGTIIKKGAKIGMGALIGAGIIIGRNAIIGAGSVVTKNIPAGETWVGSPAYPIDLRSKFPKFELKKMVDIDFANFVVGFVSGEGYFSEQKNGKYICFGFGIEVNYRDRRTIEKIKEFFETGHIYERRRKTLVNKLDAHQIIYQVKDEKSLKNIIIPFFDNFLLKGNKKIQYLRWRENYLNYKI